MSQRELATAAKVGKNTIADLESEQMLNPRLFTLLRLAHIVEWRLVFVDRNGLRVRPYQSGIALDSAGRELPAHLDAQVRPEPNYWWQRSGGYTYFRDRERRDDWRTNGNQG